MLEGKTVLCPDPKRLSFFYPDFRVTSLLSEWTLDKKVIYNGRFYGGLENDLKLYTKSFISLVGKPEITLSSSSDWLRFAYQRHNKQIPKYVLEVFDSLDEDEIWFAIKSVWVSGKWPLATLPSERIFTLFQASSKSFIELLRQYYTLVEEYPLGYVESSFLTFLLKVKDAKELSTDEVSPRYLQVLRNVNSRVRTKLPYAIDIFMRQPKGEARFIQLLFNLFQ